MEHHWYLVRTAFRPQFNEERLDTILATALTNFLEAVVPEQEEPVDYEGISAENFQTYRTENQNRQEEYALEIELIKEERQSYLERNAELKSLPQATYEGVLNQLYAFPEPIQYPAFGDDAVLVDDWEASLKAAEVTNDEKRKAHEVAHAEYNNYVANIKEKRATYDLKGANFIHLNDDSFKSQSSFDDAIRAIIPDGLEDEYSQWKLGYMQPDLLMRTVQHEAGLSQFEEVQIVGNILMTHIFKSFGVLYRLLLHHLGGDQWSMVEQTSKQSKKDPNENQMAYKVYKSEEIDAYENAYFDEGEEHEKWFTRCWDVMDSATLQASLKRFLEEKDIEPLAQVQLTYRLRKTLANAGIALKGVRVIQATED